VGDEGQAAASEANVGDERNGDGFTYQPVGRRRVSMLIAVPVIAGCATIGSVAGALHPLSSLFGDRPTPSHAQVAVATDSYAPVAVATEPVADKAHTVARAPVVPTPAVVQAPAISPAPSPARPVDKPAITDKVGEKDKPATPRQVVTTVSSEEPPTLRAPSQRETPAAPVAVAKAATEQAPASPPSSMLSTGSVDQPARAPVTEAPGGGQAKQDAAHLESPAPNAAHGQRIARIKRLKRVHTARRVRPKPQGAEVDKFFSQIFPKQ
jgi:hypothetical protein